jgi:Prohead core protein serine protease
MLLKGISDYIGTPLEVLEESVNGKKCTYLIGTCIVAESVNKNNRRYSAELLAPEVDRYINECVNENRAYAQLNHPSDLGIDLERVCARHVQIVREGNTWKTKAILTDNALGDVVRGIVTTGGRVGWSSRGGGNLERRGNINEVRNYRLVAIDLVSDPSAVGCWANGILENVNYLINGDGVLVEAAHEARDTLRKAERTGTLSEFQRVKAFKDYIDKIVRR